EGLGRFMDWLRGPAPHGGAHGINRYAYRIYLEREDLPRAYPDLDGADGPGFAGWAIVYGAPEAGIPRDLLPPVPAFLESPPQDIRSDEEPPEPSVNAVG